MTNTYRETDWRDDSEKSSDEIKADIERTRNNMSAKLDSIQDRLSPDNLKQQAQTMVQDVVKESTDAITDYVSTTVPQVTNTVVDLVRHNPVPAALIGIGLGWLLVRSMSDHDDYDRSYTRSYRSRYRPQQQYEDAYRSATYPSDATYYTGDYPRSSETEYSNDYGRGDLNRMRQQYQGENLGNGGSSQGIVDKVRNTVSDVSEQVTSAAHTVADTASNLVEQATQATGVVRHQAARLGNQASDLGGQAQHAGHQVQQTIEDSPLAFGAVALAVGAIIGLALPATRRENEWLGETRDRFVENAQEVASDVAQRVQQVASEVAPKVEEAAKKVAEDVKQSTKTAAETVTSSVKSATGEIKQELEQKTEDERQKLANENQPNNAQSI